MIPCEEEEALVAAAKMTRDNAEAAYQAAYQTALDAEELWLLAELAYLAALLLLLDCLEEEPGENEGPGQSEASFAESTDVLKAVEALTPEQKETLEARFRKSTGRALRPDRYYKMLGKMNLADRKKAEEVFASILQRNIEAKK